MAPLKALVFDMDDTLYPEHTYVESGFQAVAKWLESEMGLFAKETVDFLQTAQATKHRGRVFDALLEHQPTLAVRVTVADLVQVYRTHRPNIQLYPGMADLLDQARAHGFRIGLISDGYLDAQTRKVEALELIRWADPIILTDTWGRDFWKPNPRAFQTMEAAFGLSGPALAYIGDNPAKDFIAPNQRRWITVHLGQPNQIHPMTELMPSQAIAAYQVKETAGLSRLLQTRFLPT